MKWLFTMVLLMVFGFITGLSLWANVSWLNLFVGCLLCAALPLWGAMGASMFKEQS